MCVILLLYISSCWRVETHILLKIQPWIVRLLKLITNNYSQIPNEHFDQFTSRWQFFFNYNNYIYLIWISYSITSLRGWGLIEAIRYEKMKVHLKNLLKISITIFLKNNDFFLKKNVYICIWFPNPSCPRMPISGCPPPPTIQQRHTFIVQ